MTNARRILVIGSPGAGKTTLSIKLGELLNLPVIHLDKEFWNPGWVETPVDPWRDQVRELAAGDEWIIDGSFDGTLEIRLQRADTVVFLDYSRAVCMWRVFKRIVTRFGRTSPFMADGCPEKLDPEFIKFVWNYRRIQYPNIKRKLDEHFAHGNLISLHSPDQTEQFLLNLSGPPPSRG
jgi:adenylate kinase family enzyme